MHAFVNSTALLCIVLASLQGPGLLNRSDFEPTCWPLSGSQAPSAAGQAHLRGSASFTVFTGGPAHKRMLSALVNGVQERVHQVHVCM